MFPERLAGRPMLLQPKERLAWGPLPLSERWWRLRLVSPRLPVPHPDGEAGKSSSSLFEDQQAAWGQRQELAPRLLVQPEHQGFLARRQAWALEEFRELLEAWEGLAQLEHLELVVLAWQAEPTSWFLF